MSLSVNEFVELTKKEPNKWNHYCEILILHNGLIELAEPSHMEKGIKIYCEKMNMSKEEFIEKFPTCLAPFDFICEKYGIVALWHSIMRRPPKLSRFQERTINILIKNKLLNIMVEKVFTEYTYYLKWKEERNFPEGL